MDEYVYTPGDGLVIQGEPEPGKLYRENDFNHVITIPEREEERVHYWINRINLLQYANTNQQIPNNDR